MFKTEEEEKQFTLVMSSDHALVERAVKGGADFVASVMGGENFNFRLVLRELLNNAVEHGNQSNKDRVARLVVRVLSPEQIEVNVEDEGAGFDLAAIPLEVKKAEGGQERHRGLALVNQFCDSMRAEKNFGGHQGFRLIVHFAVQRETGFELSEPAVGTQRLEIRGDLTASNAEKLRGELLALMARKPARAILGMAGVNDLDSTALGVLASFGRSATEKLAGVDLSIEGAHSDIVNLFHLTRLDRLFRFS